MRSLTNRDSVKAKHAIEQFRAVMGPKMQISFFFKSMNFERYCRYVYSFNLFAIFFLFLGLFFHSLDYVTRRTLILEEKRFTEIYAIVVPYVVDIK